MYVLSFSILCYASFVWKERSLKGKRKLGIRQLVQSKREYSDPALAIPMSSSFPWAEPGGPQFFEP